MSGAIACQFEVAERRLILEAAVDRCSTQSHRSGLARHARAGWQFRAELQRTSRSGYRHDAGGGHPVDASGQ